MSSNRISELINCIKYSSLVDVGCDHGYISIDAIKMGYAKTAIATDVNIGPLNKAKANIEEEGLDKKIKTILSNGLRNLPENSGETMIIAGMGGYLIKDILSDGNLSSFKQIILQPQSDISLVRKVIINLGFYIEYEKIIIDRNKYYFIMNCLVGSQNPYSKEDLILGKNIVNKEIYISYLKEEIKKREMILTKTNREENIYLLGIFKERLNEVNGYL